jgi:hypothetical protein
MKTGRESLEDLFTDGLKLSDDAAAYLLDVWDLIQFFDDVYDGDRPVGVYDAVVTALIRLPCNAFHVKHSGQLTPLLHGAILKWIAANRAEADGRADARSFMWRAAYYDLVLFAFTVCHGHDQAVLCAETVLSLYGESFDDYMQAMHPCPTP